MYSERSIKYEVRKVMREVSQRKLKYTTVSHKRSHINEYAQNRIESSYEQAKEVGNYCKVMLEVAKYYPFRVIYYKLN